MAALTETFSESWHRIAGRRIALRTGVRVRRQFFRGERWHIVFEPFSNQFFRVRAGAWDFLARLGGGRTVQQCWDEALSQHPDSAPGQEEVIRLLAQLYHANLIRSDLPPDAEKLFERHRKRRRREVRSRWMSLLFVRIPLVDPDAVLARALPLVRWLFSWLGAVLWLGVVGWAVKLGVENWDRLWQQSQSVLAPSNIAWMYVALVVLKLLHELGHAFTCRHFGGEVHTLGVMVLVFSPLPFVDATAAWGFRERWQRVAVGAAGMVVELFVAALAVFVWSATGPGLMNGLAYNVIFIASVSTFLANANPLLRFDGYYILCDIIDMPNLAQRASRTWRHWCERFLFGNRRSTSPAESRREAAWLGIYGAASFVYRIFLFAGILLFVAGQWLLLGALMAVAGLVTWLVVPIGKFIHYLASNPQLERVRRRAIGATAGLTAGVIGLLALVPMPDSFSAPGVVQSEDYTVVYTASEGRFVDFVAESEQPVQPGDVLLRLENPELGKEIESARAEEVEVLALERAALDKPGEGLAAIRERLVAVRKRLKELERLHADLEVRAPIAGIWVAPSSSDLEGRWVGRGSPIGEIVGHGRFRFSAVVRQEDASNLFGDGLRSAGVRLRGSASDVIRVARMTIIPAQQSVLPSAVLGWMGGGDIATRQDDRSGTRSAESFFELRAALDDSGGVRLWHGRSGKLRCALPRKPLLAQWWRDLRQLVQRRLQV